MPTNCPHLPPLHHTLRTRIPNSLSKWPQAHLQGLCSPLPWVHLPRVDHVAVACPNAWGTDKGCLFVGDMNSAWPCGQGCPNTTQEAPGCAGWGWGAEWEGTGARGWLSVSLCCGTVLRHFWIPNLNLTFLGVRKVYLLRWENMWKLAFSRNSTAVFLVPLTLSNLYYYFPPRRSVHFLSPWTWKELCDCFDKQNMAEVISHDFGCQIIKGSLDFSF